MRLPQSNPHRPRALGGLPAIHGRLSTLERHVATLLGYFNGGAPQGAPVVDTLGPAGRIGRLVVLSIDHKLYRDDGTSWVAIG